MELIYCYCQVYCCMFIILMVILNGNDEAIPAFTVSLEHIASLSQQICDTFGVSLLGGSK